jgi:hypothetical protein
MLLSGLAFTQLMTIKACSTDLQYWLAVACSGLQYLLRLIITNGRVLHSASLRGVGAQGGDSVSASWTSEASNQNRDQGRQASPTAPPLGDFLRRSQHSGRWGVSRIQPGCTLRTRIALLEEPRAGSWAGSAHRHCVMCYWRC